MFGTLNVAQSVQNNESLLVFNHHNLVLQALKISNEGWSSDFEVAMNGSLKLDGAAKFVALPQVKIKKEPDTYLLSIAPLLKKLPLAPGTLEAGLDALSDQSLAIEDEAKSVRIWKRITDACLQTIGREIHGGAIFGDGAGIGCETDVVGEVVTKYVDKNGIAQVQVQKIGAPVTVSKVIHAWGRWI